MKKKLAFRAAAVVMAALMTAGAMSACKKDDAKGAGGSTANPNLDADGYDRSDGLAWDPVNKEYVPEDAILNGSAELVIWIDNDKLGDAIVEAYKKKYPNVNLTWRNVGTTDSEQKMALEGEAGTGGDVFMMVHDHFGAALNSAILGSMGRYEDTIKERAPESAWGTVQNAGRLYGVPLTLESLALFYNKTLLEKLAADGVIASAEPAKDFSEIFDLAAKYNDPAASKWTLRWQADDAYYDYMFLTPYGYQLFGANHDNPDLINFNTDAGVKGLKFLASLKSIFNVAAGDANWDYTTTAFKAGETPYLISGPWSREAAEEGAVENGFEYGITTIPKVDGQTVYTFSGVQIGCVSSYTKYPAAARNLAMFLGGDEMSAFVYSTLAKIPALTDTYADKVSGLKDDPKAQGIMAQAAFSNPMPSIPEMAHYWSVSKTMYISVFDGLLSPEDAANKAQEEYNTLRSLGN